ncbi:aspartate beta-hydroxylase domain-containing protein 2-like [Glandiceps talaboti]
MDDIVVPHWYSLRLLGYYLDDSVLLALNYFTLVILALLFIRYRWLAPPIASGRENPESSDVSAFTTCESPDCVRCRNYLQLEGQLLPKLEGFAKEHSWNGLERILSAIEEADVHRVNQELTLQQPNILFLPGLYSDPWHNITRTRDVQVLIENYIGISNDFKNVYTEFQSGCKRGWLTNNVPSGEWHVFHLINQGVRIDDNCLKCPNTAAILGELEHIMDTNVFGNATFSVLQPGTHITEHYGPTNVRIRCHLGITIPPKCHLIVAGESRQWIEQDCITFDDSFLHEAKHDGTDKDGTRVVFMVDLWHPDVTELERDVLNDLFSPSLK